MKKAYIIHGWSGHPEEGWFPWAKTELEDRGYEVTVPNMPHPHAPSIKDWVDKLKEIAPKPDEDTLFIGHSIGCQTILHYLNQLPSTTRIKQLLFVAGWFTLQNLDGNSKTIARPWLEMSVDFNKIIQQTSDITVILSTDDQYVNYEENKKLFASYLQANIITVTGGHLGGEDNVFEIPEIFQVLY